MSLVLMGSLAMSLWALSRSASPSLNWKESELLGKSIALRTLITGEAVPDSRLPIMRQLALFPSSLSFAATVTRSSCAITTQGGPFWES